MNIDVREFQCTIPLTFDTTEPTETKFEVDEDYQGSMPDNPETRATENQDKQD